MAWKHTEQFCKIWFFKWKFQYWLCFKLALQNRFFHTVLIVWVSAEFWNFKRVLENWKFCLKIRKPSDLGVIWAVTKTKQNSSTSQYFSLSFHFQALLQDWRIYLNIVMPFRTINIENIWDPKSCQQSENPLKIGLWKIGSPQCKTSVSILNSIFPPYNRILLDQKKLFGNYALIHKQNPRSWGFFHDSWKRGQNEKKVFLT